MLLAIHAGKKRSLSRRVTWLYQVAWGCTGYEEFRIDGGTPLCEFVSRTMLVVNNLGSIRRQTAC